MPEDTKEVGLLAPGTVDTVDLSVDKIAEPLNAYRVNEGRYAIAAFSREKPYLITYGLLTCKGIIFYNQATKKGLVCHLSTVRDLSKTIASLVTDFGENPAVSDVFVVESTSAKKTMSGNHYWPSTGQLALGLKKIGFRKIFVDANQAGIKTPRGISLNLETGDVREIDNSNRWTWSKQQDTSTNRYID